MAVSENDPSRRYLGKTLFGLEEVLAAELDALGAKRVRTLNRAVKFSGPREILYRANLWCRCATRVLVPLHTFMARDDRRLYREVHSLRWDRIITPRQTLAIDVTLMHSKLTHSQYVAQKTKDAIVDQMRKKLGRRPYVDTKNPDVRINLHISGNEATLSLDASGASLSRRGYRTEGGEAPMNEALAAGIIALSGWDGTVPLVDGMCGSGTILIEAALKARRIAPGLNREFGFMNWHDFDRPLWERLVAEVKKGISSEAPPLVGNDSDPKAIATTSANARRAGVADSIKLQTGDFGEFDPPDGPGFLIMNPPYGERMVVDQIRDLYRSIGDALKSHFAGYQAFIFTANEAAAKNIGLRASRRIRLNNPPLEGRLLRFEMYEGSRKKRAEKDSD